MYLNTYEEIARRLVHVGGKRTELDAEAIRFLNECGRHREPGARWQCIKQPVDFDHGPHGGD